ncbi:hypothetical protein AGLY_003815, partial [Aphis glycines]
ISTLMFKTICLTIYRISNNSFQRYISIIKVLTPLIQYFSSHQNIVVSILQHHLDNILPVVHLLVIFVFPKSQDIYYFFISKKGVSTAIIPFQEQVNNDKMCLLDKKKKFKFSTLMRVKLTIIIILQAQDDGEEIMEKLKSVNGSNHPVHMAILYLCIKKLKLFTSDTTKYYNIPLTFDNNYTKVKAKQNCIHVYSIISRNVYSLHITFNRMDVDVYACVADVHIANKYYHAKIYNEYLNTKKSSQSSTCGKKIINLCLLFDNHIIFLKLTRTKKKKNAEVIMVTNSKQRKFCKIFNCQSTGNGVHGWCFRCSFFLLISFVVFFSEGIFEFGFSRIKCMLKTKKHIQGTKENKQR